MKREVENMKRKNLKRRKIEAIARLVVMIVLALAFTYLMAWAFKGAMNENSRPVPAYMLEVVK